MLRKLTLLPALLLCLLLPAYASAQNTFTNPLLVRPEGVADPFVLKFNGEYYLYTTGNPIKAFHSRDLVHWDEIGGVLSASTDAAAWNQADIWAPEVVYRNGLFYLYYSGTKASDDWRVGEFARRVGVGVSDSPRGPFVDVGMPVTPGWAIDGHVFTDPDSGQEYLFYSYLLEPEYPGAGIVVDPMTSPVAVAGNPTLVIRGSEAWEDKDGNPNNGSLRYTNEAPTVVKKFGRYYMMYSGGSWDTPAYAMAYAFSDSVMHPTRMAVPSWNKVVPPILRTTPQVDGPGHHSVVKGPNNIDDYVAFHARPVPFRSAGDRQTFLDRLYWTNEQPFMMPPTVDPLPMPYRPLFEDRFDRASGLNGWTMQRGNWTLSDEALRFTGRDSGALGVTAEPLSNYVFEANIRIEAATASAGVTAFSREGSSVEVWVDAKAATISLVTGDGKTMDVGPLPAGYKADAWHQILVVRNGAELVVSLDGVRRLKGAVQVGPASVGVRARGGAVSFDGIALTSGFEDTFDTPYPGWKVTGGLWTSERGIFRQHASGASRFEAHKGDASAHYEFSVDVRMNEVESTDATVGVVAATAGDMRVLAGFQQTNWPVARFFVRHLDGSQEVTRTEYELPRGFLYDQFHNLRVVKQGDSLTVFLDGVRLGAVQVSAEAAVPGVYTEGARAAFDNATLIRR